MALGGHGRIGVWFCACIVFITACTKPVDGLEAFLSGDYRDAYQLWFAEAKGGDSEAQNYLGMLYQVGLGVEPDYGQAVGWYRLVARRGNAHARRNLGTMYQFGWDVKLNLLYAYAWYDAALRGGNSRARDYLEAMANKLTPNQIVKAKLLLRGETDRSESQHD